MDKIQTVDENGEEVSFELVEIVEVDGTEYALLLPDTDEEQDNDEEEVVLMRLKKDGDDFIFEAIENDEEFQSVVEAIQAEEEMFEEETEEK